MAITKVGAMTNPPVEGDYSILQAKLDAYAKQIGNQGMILTQWINTTTKPDIALGSYIVHGGTLFIVDTEDYAVTAPVADGFYYLKVAASGDTLALAWVASTAGYVWNAIYNGLYHTDGSQILPYALEVIGAVTVFNKGKIINLMQGSGFVTVDYLGTIVGKLITGDRLLVTGTISGASLDTGSGALTFDQDVKTTASPHFANMNPPVDNNDASMPSVGIGGFSYAVDSTSTDGAYPSITIGSGGTWVYIANSARISYDGVVTVGRVAGGLSVQGTIPAGSNSPASVSVIAWRIA